MSDELYFSVIRGGPLYSFRRRIGLVPEQGLGLAKRWLIIVAIAWLPVVVAAAFEGLAFEGSRASDPLLRHYGVHARFLLAIPLLLLAEVLMEKAVPSVTRQFVATGLVDGENMPAFLKVLRKAESVRDSAAGLIVILGLTAATIVAPMYNTGAEEMSWASVGNGIGIAGRWYMYISRPIFAMLLSVWLWRMFTLWYFQARLSGVKLKLVPSHPDGAGGLGFVTFLTTPVAPVIFGISLVLAGRWAHDVRFHGVHVKDLQPLMVTYVIVVLVLFVGPVLLASRSLLAFKRASLLQYGRLLGHQGRMFHQRWILKQAPDDPSILDVPELGPLADGISLYNAVNRMRPVVVSKATIVPVALAAVLPLVPVLALEMPLGEVLKKLALTLV